MNTRTWKSAPKTILGLTALLCAGPGCVLTETAQRPKEVVPTGAVTQVHATWENRVVSPPDVVHGGAPLPGLACRMYLLSPEGKPIQGNGSVVVDLHELVKADGANQPASPKLLERWEIDHATLQRLLRKDEIGWGYTLFLPWGTYRPEIARVQMQIRYLDKGLPQFSPPAVVTLQNESPIVLTQHQVAASDAPRDLAIQPPPPAPPQATR